MPSIAISYEDVISAGAEAAAEECAAAKAACRLAKECADEAEAISRDDVELGAEWASAARLLSGIALGHSHKAAALAPGSREAKESREAAALSRGYARAAELAAVRD